MSIDYKKLGRELKASEIEFRVSATSLFGNDATVTLVAYKDARVDMNILDEVAGPGNWQDDYFRDQSNVLFCKIGIYNESLKEWIWKVSNGIESNTEKVKGEASDAFKRAGFMWGIGRTLYDMPLIKVKLLPDEFEKEGNKAKPKPWFRPNDWTWTVDISKGYVKAVDTKGSIRVQIENGVSILKASRGTNGQAPKDNPPTPTQNEPESPVMNAAQEKLIKSLMKAEKVPDKLRQDIERHMGSFTKERAAKCIDELQKYQPYVKSNT